MNREEALAQRQWYVIDAQGKILGRMATEIAKVLRGKHKPSFTPNQDAGDFVIVVNARNIKLTGTKLRKKDLLPAQRNILEALESEPQRRCSKKNRKI